MDQPFYAPEEHAIPQPSLRVLVTTIAFFPNISFLICLLLGQCWSQKCWAWVARRLAQSRFQKCWCVNWAWSGLCQRILVKSKSPVKTSHSRRKGRTLLTNTLHAMRCRMPRPVSLYSVQFIISGCVVTAWPAAVSLYIHCTNVAAADGPARPERPSGRGPSGQAAADETSDCRLLIGHRPARPAMTAATCPSPRTCCPLTVT